MGWEVAKRAIDFLMKESRERRGVEILFFGNEPLSPSSHSLKLTGHDFASISAEPSF
jgi:hypothetical protein